MDSNMFAALNDSVISVKVAFEPDRSDDYFRNAGKNKTYSYKALRAYELKAGDKVVVDAAGTLKVATVTEVDDTGYLPPNMKYKWVIQRIDFTKYEEVKTKEEEFNKILVTLERKKKAQKLRESIIELIGEDQIAKLTVD